MICADWIIIPKRTGSENTSQPKIIWPHSAQRKVGMGNNWTAKVFGARNSWEVVLGLCHIKFLMLPTVYFTGQLSVSGPWAGSYGEKMCEEGYFCRTVLISWVLTIKPNTFCFPAAASFLETPDSPTPPLHPKANVILLSLIQFLYPSGSADCAELNLGDLWCLVPLTEAAVRGSHTLKQADRLPVFLILYVPPAWFLSSHQAIRTIFNIFFL